jgi:hypothetical protein
MMKMAIEMVGRLMTVKMKQTKKKMRLGGQIREPEH